MDKENTKQITLHDAIRRLIDECKSHESCATCPLRSPDGRRHDNAYCYFREIRPLHTFKLKPESDFPPSIFE